MGKVKLYINDKLNWIEPIIFQYFEFVEKVNNVEEASICLINKQDQVVISDNIKDLALKKPVSISQLLNSLEVYMQKFLEKAFKIGKVDFYPAKRICCFLDEEISLTEKETEILLYFIEKEGKVDKESLLQEVFGYTKDMESHTVETHIYNLRNKFINKYEIVSFQHPYYILNS